MAETPPLNDQPNRTMAYASLGSAVVSWILGAPAICAGGFFSTPALICGGIVYLLGNIAAAVTGYLGRNQASESGDEGAGKMATAGLGLGAVGTVLGILLFCLIAAQFIMGPIIGNVYSNIFSETGGSAPDDGFTRYQTSDFSELVASAPTLALEHPSDWSVGWVHDSGITALMLTSGGDVQEAFWNPDLPEASILILVGDYSGQDLLSLFRPEANVIEEPSLTKINGLDAARRTYLDDLFDDKMMKIDVVIVSNDVAFSLWASFPAEQEEQFRPVVEQIIDSIELK